MPDDPRPTPKLDELEQGPWPSFVKELKRAAESNPMSEQLLGVLELSYEDDRPIVRVTTFNEAVAAAFANANRGADMTDERATVRTRPLVGEYYDV